VESIGQYLKEKREELNLSIENISNEIKLKDYIIKQIENDDFDAIGDTGFIKIMVITYCRAVQGDENLVLNSLLKKFNKTPAPPIKINTAKKRKKPILLSMSLVYFVLLTFLVFFLTFYVVKFYKQGIISFKAIKEQLAFSGKKDSSKVLDENAELDSLWVYHRQIFNEKNNIDTQMPAVTRTTVIDTSAKEETIKPITDRKMNNNYSFLKDKTDYVNLLIFNNEPGPLNQEIDFE